jgi:hypothetical protein
MVDREAFYNADPASSPEEDAASPAGPPTSPQEEEEPPASSASAPSPTSSAPSEPSLSQKLRLALDDAGQLPDLRPELQPVSIGAVRADLHRPLEQAVAVLNTRYTAPVSQQLIVEFALRRTLRNLQEHDVESALVRWLDTALPQG